MRTRDNDESFDRNVKIVSQVNEFLTPSPFSMIKMKKCLFQLLIRVWLPDPNIHYNRIPLQRVVINIIFKYGDN